MGLRRTDEAVMNVIIKSSKEECVLDMERKSSYAAAMGVQIKPSEEACAGGTGQFLQPIKDALINLFYLNQNQRSF